MAKPTDDRPAVLVTGASRGIGAATARALVARGANVAIHARSEGRLNELATELRDAGARVEVVIGDIRQVATSNRLVKNALVTLGRLDALVANAGIIEPIASIAEADDESWVRNIEVNLFGVVWAARAALAHLRESRGRIVAVSSGAALHPVRGWSAYCASKAALNMFTASLAAEEPDVTSIAFSPGMTATDMQAVVRAEGQAGMPAEDLVRFTGAFSRGELRSPARVGDAVAAIALAAPSAWSGEFMSVDDERVTALVG